MLLTEVALVTQHGQPAGGQLADDTSDPGSAMPQADTPYPDHPNHGPPNDQYERLTVVRDGRLHVVFSRTPDQVRYDHYRELGDIARLWITWYVRMLLWSFLE